MLTSAGVKVLRNDMAEFNGLNFIGFDDFWGMNFGPEGVMKNYNKDLASVAMS